MPDTGAGRLQPRNIGMLIKRDPRGIEIHGCPYGGNYIVLDLGAGTYASYGHARSGSVVGPTR